MIDELSIRRLIPAEREELFNYFIAPDLLEMWAYPNDTKLKVPLFEARIGGHYRFEYTGKNRTYVWIGDIKDFQSGSLISEVDNLIDKEGNPILKNIETVFTFSEKPGGTFLTITQKNFPDEKALKECEKEWNLYLDRLTSIFINKEVHGTL